MHPKETNSSPAKPCGSNGATRPGQRAPFAELVRLSQTSVANEMREEHRRRVLGE
jgi:hypothetical protein